jgi:polyamine oxidase
VAGRRRGDRALSGTPRPRVAARVDRRRFLAGAGALAAAPFAGALLAACSDDDAPRTGRALDPDAVLRTRWADDPFARGAYSYVPLGVTNGAAVRGVLAAPIEGQLFFAGEATSVDAPATVHGAIASGRRAAGEVLASGARPGTAVVVLGAGAAGLAAAAELRSAGLTPVVVEARDRTGGRVHTDTSLGVPVDLGAAWVHDAREGNPVLPLARRASVTLRAVEHSTILRGADGRRLDAARAVERIERALARVGEGSGADDELDRRVRAEAAAVGLREPALTWAITSAIELELGAAATEVSWRSFDEGDGDAADALPAGGYGPVLSPLAEGLDIRLGTPVATVQWSRARNRLVTANGAEIPFEHCVVTLPLGVLQAGAPAFDPPLPAAKAQAIRALGSGLVDKLALRFPEVFWERDVDWLGFTGTTPGEWAEWANLAPATGAPVLVGFNAATVARTFTARTDEQVVTSARSALRTMYG